MKRLIVCCDGTWNGKKNSYPTNVQELHTNIPPMGNDGVKQISHYEEGVGVGKGATFLDRCIDVLGGGAFGWGLTTNMLNCYRFLVQNYDLGDEIYVFGYSRGAYTARSLVGLIRSCSIPERKHIKRLHEGVEYYRTRNSTGGADALALKRFRQDTSPNLYTSKADLEFRGKTEGELTQLQIKFVGVWDTVGALGIPNKFAVSSLFNKRYQFHDTQLSRSVCSAYHAVALDERRMSYVPTLWDNIADLNELNGSPGNDPYQQSWFPGVHGSVGGGGEILDLSSETLRWVLEGARQSGMFIKPSFISELEARRNHCGPLTNTAKSASMLGSLGKIFGVADRNGPLEMKYLSRFALKRWWESADNLPNKLPYRPGSLRNLSSTIHQAKLWF